MRHDNNAKKILPFYGMTVDVHLNKEWTINSSDC